VNRKEVIAVFAGLREGGPVITGPGATSGTLYVTRHEPATIYNMEMGYATAMSLGVALAARNEWVVALEGDASTVAGMPVLATIGRYQPPNLTVVVFDNGVFGTGSGVEPSASSGGLDIAAVARGCGIDKVINVSDVEQLGQSLRRAKTEPGPWVVVALIDKSDAAPSAGRPRPQVDVTESGIYFFRAMRERSSG
jgi:sulfopyruvate decarboxylase subunit beta